MYRRSLISNGKLFRSGKRGESLPVWIMKEHWQLEAHLIKNRIFTQFEIPSSLLPLNNWLKQGNALTITETKLRIHTCINTLFSYEKCLAINYWESVAFWQRNWSFVFRVIYICVYSRYNPNKYHLYAEEGTEIHCWKLHLLLSICWRRLFWMWKKMS